jgi:hypothetical protein
MAYAITATTDAANARVQVSVTGATDATGYIQRLDATGASANIRNGEPATYTAGAWTDYDYEAPMDVPVSYRVLSADLTTVQASTAGTVTLASNGATWLKHPSQPTLNGVLKVTSLDNLLRKVPQGVFYVQGRPLPVVTSGRRFAPTGDLICYTETLAERQWLLNLLTSGQVLLLSTPDGYGLGNLYVSVGDVPEDRKTPIVDNPVRSWTLPLTVTDRPVGVSTAGTGNTWADVLTYYPTWADVVRTKATWGDLVTRVAPTTPAPGS